MNSNKLTRIKFKDTDLENAFERDGYVVIKNMVTGDALNNMIALFNHHYKVPEEKVVSWNTAAMLGKEEKTHISDELMKSLTPALNTYIEKYTPPFAYFLTKPAEKTATNISMHRDASAVDENVDEYLIFWMPLVDLNENNGCLYMMPGSNKFFLYELPFGADWPYKNLLKEMEPYKVDLKMNAGDAVIFSGKTLHGSYPNASDSPRPAVCCGLIDPSTQLLYYYYNRSNNKVETYKVDPDFFLNSDFSDPETKYPLHSSFNFTPPVIQAKDLKSFYNKGEDAGNKNFFEKLKAIFA